MLHSQNSISPESHIVSSIAGKPGTWGQTVKLDGQEIEDGDASPENRNKYSDRYCVIPELNEQPRCRQLESKCNRPREPIDPAHGETKTRV